VGEGAIVMVRYRVSAMLDHEEPDWVDVVRQLIEDEGIIGMADELPGEIVSIEKWEPE